MRLIDKDKADVEMISCYYGSNCYVEDIQEWLNEQPTIDAVEVEKYKALLEMYNELRENFIDFVCSGTSNVAPYCLNRCDGCCDTYGWCRYSDKCQGFNPAEVILDCGAKMDLEEQNEEVSL